MEPVKVKKTLEEGLLKRKRKPIFEIEKDNKGKERFCKSVIADLKAVEGKEKGKREKGKPSRKSAASQQKARNAILWYSLIEEETSLNKWVLRKPMKIISKDTFHQLMVLARNDEKLRDIMFNIEPNSDDTEYTYRNQREFSHEDEEEFSEIIK
ncbi:MAG: hypothetical protein GY861_11935 [bacterium]|nr:hypothetical protein [bacterium]